jgi:hypothetical protein
MDASPYPAVPAGLLSRAPPGAGAAKDDLALPFFRNARLAPSLASPSTAADRLTMASGQIMLAACSRREKSSGVIFTFICRVRLTCESIKVFQFELSPTQRRTSQPAHRHPLSGSEKLTSFLLRHFRSNSSSTIDSQSVDSLKYDNRASHQDGNPSFAAVAGLLYVPIRQTGRFSARGPHSRFLPSRDIILKPTRACLWLSFRNSSASVRDLPCWSQGLAELLRPHF